jgi:hypothetical protein
VNEKQLIKKYYEGYEEFPSKVTSIKDCPDRSGHYYEVSYKNRDGKFTDTVFVENGIVLVLPE